uniref:CSON012980 protein n=1 Tax=Culicoides sonorensis TaxID=179676 RepID=A0A336LMR2_CULSO
MFKEKKYLTSNNKKMPTCPAPTIPSKKCISTGDIKRSDLISGGINGGGLLEPHLNNVGDPRWNKTPICPPSKGVYTWMSPPKAILGQRKISRITGSQKFRDEGGQSISLQQNQQQHLQATQTQSNYQNVMHDRRIVRGTNFNNLNSAEGDSSQKEYEKQRRIMLRNKQLGRNQRNIIGTPPPCKGRKHENVQTEKYLEELFDRPPEFDVCCQTDLFLQRPPTPKHVPGIAGVDASTEILDGELFDFDTEVQPIIETLVGRTLEQALIEVMHEEELADLKEQQQKLLAIREKEEAEVRRLEEQEMRLKSEKKRRLAQDMLTKELDSEMQQRVTAAKLIQGYISDLLPGVLEDIEPLRETADRQLLEEQLKPWLAQEVAEEIGQMIDSRDLLEEIVKQVLKHRAELYTNLHRNRNESVAIEDLNDTAEINDADPDQTN